MQNLVRDLARITGEDNVFPADSDRVACASWPFNQPAEEKTMPLAVVRPTHTGHLRELLHYCREHDLPVRVRGGGTSTAMRENCHGSVMILTTGLNRIIDIDPPNRVILVQGGTSIAALSALARRHSLFYPPAESTIATIGGAVADNASCLRSVKYGTAIDYVREMEIFTTSGEKFFASASHGQPAHLAALPLASLFCGSRGQLGIISQIKLRLLPAPQTSKAILASFSENVAAAGAACAIMGTSLLPSALEIIDSHYARAMNQAWQGKTLLYVEFDGDAAQAESSLEQADAVLGRSAAEITRITDISGFTEQIFRLPGATGITDGKFGCPLACCPPARLQTLVEGINSIAAKNDIQASFFGHAGIASLNVVFFTGEENSRSAALKDLFTLELMLNGSMQSEEDAENGKKAWRDKYVPGYFQKIRHIFDPENLLSKGL